MEPNYEAWLSLLDQPSSSGGYVSGFVHGKEALDEIIQLYSAFAAKDFSTEFHMIARSWQFCEPKCSYMFLKPVSEKVG